MRKRPPRPLPAALLVVFSAAAVAGAETYQVGPGRTYTQLAGLLSAVAIQPGDVVEVDGGATYQPVNWSEGGAPGNPVTIRGLRVNGSRPVLSGGSNTIELSANHVVFEGFEVTGGSFRCVYHHAHDITVRDVYIHDCPAHGLLGADTDSGSLTLEYSEITRCGNGTTQHAIYMATNELDYPGSVFRMRFNYVHDQNGGNAVKSRAERNEITYNWIQSAPFHLLELIGPDPAGGVPADTAREDSDVVGNVLVHTGSFFFVRVGGDGTGASSGRYRFLNNTFLRTASGPGSAVFRMFSQVESIEMSNNVFFNADATAPNLYRAVMGEVEWVAGEQVAGQNNWVETGASNRPAAWTGTITGPNPRFRKLRTLQLRPAPDSPLVNAGTATPTGPPGYPFPAPLYPPAFEPPARGQELKGDHRRPPDAAIDIGAYERARFPNRR